MTDIPAEVQTFFPTSQAWEAQRLVGSFLTFSYGKKRPFRNKKGETTFLGEMYIAVRFCDWAIYRKSRELLNSTEMDDAKYGKILKKFLGRSFLSIECKENNEINLVAEDNVSVSLFQNSRYGTENEMLCIYKDQDFSANYFPDKGFVIKKTLDAR